jgi:hypothetical protein
VASRTRMIPANRPSCDVRYAVAIEGKRTRRGHFPRASDLILGKTLRGRLGHQITDAILSELGMAYQLRANAAIEHAALV